MDDSMYKAVVQYSAEVNNNIEQLIVMEVQNYYDANYAASCRERYIINAEKVIEAVMKGTAKEPLRDDEYHGIGKCPTCNAVFLDNKTNYCGNCGQKLDWSKRI